MRASQAAWATILYTKQRQGMLIVAIIVAIKQDIVRRFGFAEEILDAFRRGVVSGRKSKVLATLLFWYHRAITIPDQLNIMVFVCCCK